MNSRKNKLLFVFSALFVSMFCFVNEGHSRRVDSIGDGEWDVSTTWDSNFPFQTGDTIVIDVGDVVLISGNVSYNMDFIIVVLGTLDLSNNGKLTMDGASQVIIESGGTLYGDGSNNQITIGNGQAEFSGQTTVTGPAYVADEKSADEAPLGLPAGYTPLPVELLYFNAKPTQNQVNLSWSTASELNNDFFTLEKSNNGRDFVKLGEVTGNGTTNLLMDYAFTDHSPYLGLSYYRLSQTDYDGTTEVFPVVSVLFEGNRGFSVGSNPVSGATIKLKISEMGNHELLELNIVDLQGRLVEKKQFKTDSFGNVETEIQLKRPLQQGTYIFELVSPNSKEYLKVAAH